MGFPPKSSTLIGFSIVFTIHFGVPLFLETPILRCHMLGLREGSFLQNMVIFCGFWVAIFQESTWSNKNRCLFSLLHIECELPKCRPVHSTMCCSNIFGNSRYKLPTKTTTTGNFMPRDGTLFRKKVGMRSRNHPFNTIH